MRVLIGDRFHRESDTLFQLDPSSSNDYERLMRELGSKEIRGIVHAWSAPSSHEEPSVERIEAAQVVGSDSVLYTLQGVTSAKPRTPPKLWIVTRGAQAVEEDLSNPAQSPLWGLGAVITLEHPELRCVRVDLSVMNPLKDVTVLCDELERGVDDQVAVRNGVRYVARLTERRGTDSANSSGSPVVIDAESNVLVTGGLGALGLEVARWLVERGARHVTLVGRRAPEPSAQAVIHELEQAGAEMLVLQADVSNREDVQSVFEQADKRALVRGIVHAAGILDDGVLLQQNAERFRRTMAPKVAGTWNLHEATLERDLDFFVCFSTVQELFAAQSARTPKSTAVVCRGESLSYAELDARSNQLARHLDSLGVGVETPVGLYLERSLEMAVGLLGVLKAGGAYIPLDPAFPNERLAFMVRDAGAPIIVTQSTLVDAMPEHGGEVVQLDADWGSIARQDASAVSSPARPDTLAYVIYTSGSTGAPKGVQIEHRALTNFLCSMQKEPGLGPDDRLVAVTTLSFDIAGLELYLPWITGATVILASREEASDGRQLAELLHTAKATVVQATPATWRMMVDSGWQGDSGLKVLCGGEGLPRELADELLGRCDELWNVYGPTETTIWSTLEHITPGSGPVLVGRPISNTSVYLLDEHGQPVPTGVPGELYIGGESLARGYLKRDDLTEERFVPDPFSGVDGARMYRTGDLARYRVTGEHGKLELLGRLDHQVKVRGFRIELGEIEFVLDTYSKLKQAVVIAREDTPGDKRLVAYLVPDGELPSVTELRDYLKEKLPDYIGPHCLRRARYISCHAQRQSRPEGPSGPRWQPAPSGE